MPTHSRTSYPHEANCAECRRGTRCNMCGRRAPRGTTCAHGRCSQCHRAGCDGGQRDRVGLQSYGRPWLERAGHGSPENVTRLDAIAAALLMLEQPERDRSSGPLRHVVAGRLWTIAEHPRHGWQPFAVLSVDHPRGAVRGQWYRAHRHMLSEPVFVWDVQLSSESPSGIATREELERVGMPEYFGMESAAARAD